MLCKHLIDTDVINYNEKDPDSLNIHSRLLTLLGIISSSIISMSISLEVHRVDMKRKFYYSIIFCSCFNYVNKAL